MTIAAENRAWLAGFRARFEDKPRPSEDPNRQAGWDAADRLLQQSGGYGLPG